MKALGMIETYGLVAAVEALDSALCFSGGHGESKRRKGYCPGRR